MFKIDLFMFISDICEILYCYFKRIMYNILTDIIIGVICLISNEEISYIDKNVSNSICKKLSRLNLSISNYAFDANIIWFRVAFNKSEIWNQAKHSHSFYELHLCLSGYAIFEDREHNTLFLNPGDFILLPPKQSHKLCGVSDDFSKLVFGFALKIKKSDEYEFLQSSFEKIPIKVFQASQTMLEIPQKILDDIAMYDRGYKLMVSEMLATLIIEIARIINNHNISSIKYENKDKRLDNLILYMRDNLHRNLTVEDFAAQSNMSSKQLNRIMFENYNMSVAEFFKKERIEKAKDLLTHTELSMSQIAHKIGFSDEFSMSKIFKRLEGMTPAKYRSSYFLK